MSASGNFVLMIFPGMRIKPELEDEAHLQTMFSCLVNILSLVISLSTFSFKNSFKTSADEIVYFLENWLDKQ